MLIDSSFMEGLWLAMRQALYLTKSQFWAKVFALTFGVVSGVVLSYQRGTNFGPFTAAVGSVLGATCTVAMRVWFLAGGECLDSAG